jgi:serine phosphatase RsbU (regulator of sigma subunit)
MKKKILSFLIILILFFLISFSGNCTKTQVKSDNLPQIQNGILDLTHWNFEKNGILELNGDWEFYWNDLVSAKVDQSSPESSIPPKFMPVPSEWQEFGYPVLGYASYRLKILLPESIPRLSIDMRSIACSYEMYINGRLVSSQGKVGRTESESVDLLRYSSFEIDPNLIKEKSTMEIIFHIANFHYVRAGLWDVVRIGESEEIERDEKQKFVLDLAVISCLFIMGLYHFGLFLNRKQDRSPFYFSLFCLLVALRTISINERMILDAILSFPFWAAVKIEYFGEYFAGFLFVKYVEALFPEDSYPRYSRFLYIFFIPTSLIVVLFPMNIFGRVLIIVEIGILLTTFYLSFVLFLAVRAKRVGAKLFIFGFVILALVVAHDILKGKRIVFTPYMLGYGLLLFILFQATILSRKFAAAFSSSEQLASELKMLSQELEEKVKFRTIELEKSLEKIQSLKQQQDGDYFLTSLLLRPLNSNKSKSDRVRIEFLSSQKKKFQFREWKEEIGGDICMANNIILKGKTYTVFVNADAMGKSLQGASGALVFGSVFESIINRNRIARTTQDIFPEKWIRDAFVELHYVFETFDGSMLVSLVMGLIDERSGLLYLINADHPASILYRDGKASFIDHKKAFRKLGTLGANEAIRILTYPLSPGDVVISGSDGRDDLLVVNEEGEEYISNNDSMILRHVENANADLKQIYQELTNFGEPYDDITLLRIAFEPSGQKIQKQDPAMQLSLLKDAKDFLKQGKHEDAILLLESSVIDANVSVDLYKSLFQSYLQAREFKKAAKFSVDILEMLPEDTEVLFQVAYLYKKIGEYEQACDIGERVKLRDPEHIRNLINLADAHYMLGNVPRAKILISDVLKYDSENSHAIKRKKSLEG